MQRSLMSRRAATAVRTSSAVVIVGSTDGTTANPYLPPKSPAVATSPTARQVSFGRGMLCALPSSMIGFAIPYAALAVLPLVRFVFFGYSAANRDADLGELATKALMPAIGCSIVFALAAIVNYTPARNLGFVRALLFVGLSALFGIFAMVVAVLVLDLGPQSYTHDPFFSLRCAIGIIVTTVLAFLILRRVISAQNVRATRELYREGFERP